jgi:hypothetical protein
LLVGGERAEPHQLVADLEIARFLRQELAGSDRTARVEQPVWTDDVTKFDQVIAISGGNAVAAKLQNYRGASSKFRSVSEGSVKAALRRLGQLPPPTSA